MDVKDVLGLFGLPFTELVYRAAGVHRAHFDPSEIQLSTLLSVKTGGCPEDCAYCPQSRRYNTGVEDEELLSLDAVRAAATIAKQNGATRFCMGAAWRGPKDRDLEKIEQFIKEAKNLGLETCVTLGMLKPGQAERLREAGLDYYNHNLDTSPQFYGEIISTRTYRERLETLERVRAAGIRVCCGGIVGMGESRADRAALVAQLASLDPQPESVPINSLIQVKGTPLHAVDPIDPLEFVRTIAVTRICIPKAWVRLSAGRESMPEALQALCFLAGANSVFYGDKLLTTPNPETLTDRALFERLGLRPTAAGAAD
ncbi:MAG TPA: biotin synthase BioB [Burkholderiales bacterium]|nr:biotin synthase BioB [Burkholderiales bacterium]